MRFVDQVRIFVKAGDGGNGAVAFRREKFIEKGGPSGGDGGNGGSVIFIADDQLTTLLDFRYQQHHVARHGQHGMGSDCNGKNSDDLVLKVPVGTLFKDEPTGALLADLDTQGQIFIAAQGGRGGLGNINFATSTRQTPRFAQDGTKGEERTILLELKLLADVGLLGYPNAGKSTFISRISRAKPKVADYPFTTLVPNLGVVQYKDGLSFVMADIPGLIEGAADGVGLGHQFLRHVERCRVLVHLVDLSALSEGRDPVHEYDVLNAELKKYSPDLATKPQILVANKLDLPDAQAALAAFSATMKQRGLTVLAASGVTGEGVGKVLDAVAKVLYAPATSKPKVRAADREAEATAAKATAAKATAGKMSAANAATQASGGKSPSAKASNAKVFAAKTSAAKTSAAKTSAAKTSAAKTSAAKTSAAKTSAAKTSAAKTSAAKTSAAKTSAAKSSAAKSSAAKASGAKSSTAKKASTAKKPASKSAASRSAAPRSTGRNGARR